MSNILIIYSKEVQFCHMVGGFHSSDDESVLMEAPGKIMLLYNKQPISYIQKCHISIFIFFYIQTHSIYLSIAASKAAHEGCIVVWSLSSTLAGNRRSSKTAVSIQPLIILDWSHTDVEFIIPGARNGG